jgi:endonuclease III
MVQVAREAHPEHPGALDNPAWLIGRQWCRAGIPDCPKCPLREACPKFVERGALVRGA